MHTTLRNFLFVLLGLVVGAAVGAVGMVMFLRTDAGISILTQYVATQPQWPSVDPSQSASTTQLVNDFASGAKTIGVPKTYASAEYAAAFNASLRQVASLATSSSQLAGLLTQINNKSVSRDYSGLFDLVVSAKNIIAQQKASVALFGQALTALSVANQSTPDAVTKSMTQDFLQKGTAFQTALQTYMAALDTLLSGSVPTAQQIADLNAKVAVVGTLGIDFATASNALQARFAPKP